MTRILVLGTSHMGAVRSARDDIKTAFPMLEVDYFGLPGARFAAGRVDGNGVFAPDAADVQAWKLSQKINGREQVDLSTYDNVFLIGPKFRLYWLLRTVARYDIAEWRPAGRPAMVSEAFLVAALTAQCDNAVAELQTQFGTGFRVAIAPAAYPAEVVTQSGPHHEHPFEQMLAHPCRDRLYTLHQEMIADAVGAAGFGYVPQPVETHAGAFLTRSEYLSGAEDFRDPSRPLTDKRHMNAAYGFNLFKAYAFQELGLSPEKHPKLNKRGTENVGS